MWAAALALVLVAVKAQERHLLGEATQFSTEERARFGVGADEQVVFESASNCPESPSMPVVANNARLCGMFRNMRKCLNLTETEPLFRAR